MNIFDEQFQLHVIHSSGYSLWYVHVA